MTREYFRLDPLWDKTLIVNAYYFDRVNPVLSFDKSSDRDCLNVRRLWTRGFTECHKICNQRSK